MKAFEQGKTENSYYREEEILFGQCSRNGSARMSTLLGKAAAFGGFDYDARGLTHEVLLEKGEVFLLSRIAVRIHRNPVAGEVIRTTTWENGAKGAHMQRVYELRTLTGEKCVTMRSDWILVNPASRKILRPSSFTLKPLTICDVELDCAETKKILLPKQDVQSFGAHIVQWSEMDGNGHLHSANYADIIWNALPAELQDREVREFYINYSKEAVLGEELQLSGCLTEQGWMAEGMGSDGVCFSAEAILGAAI